MIEEILKLNKEELLQTEVVKNVAGEVDRIIRQFDVRGASQLSRFFRSKIFEDSSLSKTYGNIVAQLDFIRIGLLDDNQTIELIKNYFAVTFSFPLDILAPSDIIKRKLISASLIDQELLREKINKALKENINLLTAEKLVLASRDEKVEPTISNWLLDYDLRLADVKDRSFSRAEYLTNSPNIINLNEEEKEKIKQLIKVYDFVNTSSLIPSASPEDLIVTWDNGCSFIMSEGETIASLPPIKEFSSEETKESERKTSQSSTPSLTLKEKPEEKSAFEDKYLEEESREDE